VSTCGFWLYFGDLSAQTDLIYVVEWYYCSEILEVPPNYAVQAVEIYIGVLSLSTCEFVKLSTKIDTQIRGKLTATGTRIHEYGYSQVFPQVYSY
jgi:hypothetical protein